MQTAGGGNPRRRSGVAGRKTPSNAPCVREQHAGTAPPRASSPLPPLPPFAPPSSSPSPPRQRAAAAGSAWSRCAQSARLVGESAGLRSDVTAPPLCVCVCVQLSLSSGGRLMQRTRAHTRTGSWELYCTSAQTHCGRPSCILGIRGTKCGKTCETRNIDVY